MGIKSTLSDLYHENTNYQFMTKLWRWLLISGVLIVISIGSFLIRGLNTSIEFKGGTSFEFQMKKTPDIAKIRQFFDEAQLGEVKVQILSGDTVRITGKRLTQAQQESIVEKISNYSSVKQSEISISDVGPSWGKQLTTKSFHALIVFFLVVALYMIVRFEWVMSISAIVSMIHDVIITIGVYSVFGFVVSPATVVAFLTILGFSLYDTVVVFDKVRENTVVWNKLKQTQYSEMVNRSLNQVLARSINTSIVAILPVLSLILMGSVFMHATALLDFALALAVGLAAGAYSSMFVATPLIVAIKRWTKKADKMYL